MRCVHTLIALMTKQEILTRAKAHYPVELLKSCNHRGVEGEFAFMIV